jgi:arginyl-tRNA--protein-N-Asp/Glu arginylyltransferase
MPFYTSEPYTCPYLPGQTARTQVWLPSHGYDAQSARLPGQRYGDLLRAGFRRSGDQIYRPACPSCQACIPLRIQVDLFVPNRSQQRAWNRYQQHLQAEIAYPHTDADADADAASYPDSDKNPSTSTSIALVQEEYQLYQTYQKARHSNGSMAKDDVTAYQDFITTSSVDSYLVRFKSHSTEGATRLCMVSIMDIISDGLSAVYTFYDPSPGQSYGTFGILWQIAHARQLGLPFVYLGYWISANPQMAYKANFIPHEIYLGGRWQTPKES